AFFFVLIVAALLLTGLAKAFATLFPPLGFLFSEPAVSNDPNVREVLSLLAINLWNLAAAGIAGGVCARVLERRSVGSVGFRLHRGWSRDFGFGSVMGIATLAIAVGIAVVASALSFEVQTRSGARLALGFILVFFFFLLAGATEELVFRGFPLQALVHNLGGTAAIL